jgi:hypothetical protein
MFRGHGRRMADAGSDTCRSRVKTIEAGFETESSVSTIVEVLASLPPGVRPRHFSHEEQVESAGDVISDKERLRSFIADSKSGFFLLAPNVTYSIRIAAGHPALCDCFLTVEPALAYTFLEHIAKACPNFAFACRPEERESRNRVRLRVGPNSVESWVGRNPAKYIPGFYWLTLIPDALLERHKIDVSTVERFALEHKRIGRGLNLFRFYDSPDDWTRNDRVKELIRATPGVFNIEVVLTMLAGMTKYNEVSAVTRDWK